MRNFVDWGTQKMQSMARGYECEMGEGGMKEKKLNEEGKKLTENYESLKS